MATYNRPGVYVNELPLTAAPVNGALAAQAAGAVIAAFPQGPDTVTLVTSWYDFTKKFGGYSKKYPATFSVGSFFKNGGTELYVKRVLPAAAKKIAKVTVPQADATPVSFDIVNLEVQGTVTTKTITAASIAEIADGAGTVLTFTAANHGFVEGDSVVVTGFTSPNTFLNDTYTVNAGPATNSFEVTIASHAVVSLTGQSATATRTASTGTVAIFTTDGNHGLPEDVTEITVAGLVSPRTALNTTHTVVSSTADTITVTVAARTAEDVAISAGTLSYTLASGSFATFAAKHRGIDGNNIRVEIRESKTVRQPNYYDITVFYEAGTADYSNNVFIPANAADDVIVEQFNGVVFNDSLSGDYAPSVLEFGSSYVRILEGAVTEYNADGSTVDPVVTYTVTGTPKIDTIYPLSGAPDPEVSLTYGDYTGNYYDADAGTGFDPATGEGTFAVADCTVFTEFEVVDRPLIFFLPDVTAKIAETSADAPSGWSLSKFVYNALVDWVEAPQTTGRHFIIVETAEALSVDGALLAAGDLSETSRAAMYYPHIYIRDPLGRSTASVRRIGPSGAIAGLYLDTDRKIGPFKTPAGIDAKITEAIALERPFSAKELDNLNSGTSSAGATNLQNVVNAVRNLPGAGIVVMGGRTLKQDGTANRYVNMRRSLTYLEKRLNDLCQFAVFENNTEKLWTRINTTIGVFLNDYRNQGGLRGTTAAEAYYVKCDAENNTAVTIAAGEVHIEVGVALEYPAEFVVINLSQKTAE